MSHTYAPKSSFGIGLSAGQGLNCSTPAFGLAEIIARALDWLSCGVVIVDEYVRPVFANSAARALIRKGRLPLPCQATLHRTDPIEGIRQAITAFDNGCTMTTCRVGDPPLTCTVAKLAAQHEARAILFVTDPERKRVTCLSDVAGLGLTRAEAAFAVEFANGHNLRTCAKRLGVSVTTAKSHLQRIFAKTGACRQAELMRLILTSTPALRDDSEN